MFRLMQTQVLTYLIKINDWIHAAVRHLRPPTRIIFLEKIHAVRNSCVDCSRLIKIYLSSVQFFFTVLALNLLEDKIWKIIA